MEGRFYLHLISDSTGETLNGVARACLAQFEGTQPLEKYWNFIRTPEQMEQVIEGIAEAPGPVLFTLVDKNMRKQLREACLKRQLPCVPGSPVPLPPPEPRSRTWNCSVKNGSTWRFRLSARQLITPPCKVITSQSAF